MLRTGWESEVMVVSLVTSFRNLNYSMLQQFS